MQSRFTSLVLGLLLVSNNGSLAYDDFEENEKGVGDSSNSNSFGSGFSHNPLVELNPLLPVNLTDLEDYEEDENVDFSQLGMSGQQPYREAQSFPSLSNNQNGNSLSKATPTLQQPSVLPWDTKGNNQNNDDEFDFAHVQSTETTVAPSSSETTSETTAEFEDTASAPLGAITSLHQDTATERNATAGNTTVEESTLGMETPAFPGAPTEAPTNALPGGMLKRPLISVNANATTQTASEFSAANASETETTPFTTEITSENATESAETTTTTIEGAESGTSSTTQEVTYAATSAATEAASYPPTEAGEGGDDFYNIEIEKPESNEPPAEYIPPDDDPVKDEPQWGGEEGASHTWGKGGGESTGFRGSHHNETPEEMIHDTNVIIVVSVLAGIGFCLMVVTAQQMIENPDGCCASICRMSILGSGYICKCLCFPCYMMCGNKDRRGHDVLANNEMYTSDLELT